MIRHHATSDVLCLGFLLGTGAVAAEIAGDEVLASVGKEVILVEEFRRVESRLRRFGPAQSGRELLQPLVDREILLLEAKAEGLGMDPAVLEDVERILARRLAEEIYEQEVSQKVSVQEEELLHYFRQNGLGRKRQIRASHIQVETLEEAEAAARRLRNGADFAAVAREVSIDTSTAVKGGDMGFWQEEGAQHSSFVAQLFDLAIGETTAPYRGPDGKYHLIKATEESLLGFEAQKKRIHRIVEGQKKKALWTAYLQRLEAHYQFAVEQETLAFLLRQGQLAILGVPPVEAVDYGRVLLRYRGGQLELGAYIDMLNHVSSKSRPRAVDSVAVVVFAQDETLRKVILPAVARQRGLDRKEEVAAFVAAERSRLMIKRLRQVAVEEPVVTEGRMSDYYREHLADFTRPERTFFAGALVESQQEGNQIAARVRGGEELATVMRGYPRFRGRLRQFDVFHYTLADTARATGAYAVMIREVMGLEVGEVRGPVKVEMEGGKSGYLVLKVVAVKPAHVLAYDDPAVRQRVWRQVANSHRSVIEENFEEYLNTLRHQYDDQVEVNDQVLTSLEND